MSEFSLIRNRKIDKDLTPVHLKDQDHLHLIYLLHFHKSIRVAVVNIVELTLTTVMGAILVITHLIIDLIIIINFLLKLCKCKLILI